MTLIFEPMKVFPKSKCDVILGTVAKTAEQFGQEEQNSCCWEDWKPFVLCLPDGMDPRVSFLPTTRILQIAAQTGQQPTKTANIWEESAESDATLSVFLMAECNCNLGYK